ncbi:MAG: YitT family protein [Comamonadaceae bacterium]|nr:YitT family protein [Comamonadaceae bacterium]
MIANYFSRPPVGLLIMVLNVPVFLLGLKTMGKKHVVNSLAGHGRLLGLHRPLPRGPQGPARPPTTPSWPRSTAASCSASGWASSSAAGPRRGGSRHHRHGPQQVHRHVARLRHHGHGLPGHLGLRPRPSFQLEAPLYGYIVLFLSTKVIDMILEGWNYSKLVLITSTRTAEIADFILHGLDRSGTALRSRSLYLNREGEIIMTVIHRKQLADLRTHVTPHRPRGLRRHQRHLRRPGQGLQVPPTST